MTKIRKAAVLIAAALVLSGCGGKPEKTSEVVYNTVSEETTAAAETAASGELKKYIITCSEIAEKVIADCKDELPNTMEVEDEIMISDVLQYDMSLADDYSVYMQMISTDLFELTVIRASERNGGLVKKMLEERRDYLQNQAAFYPQQVAAAEATIVGEINGVYYLICSEKAEDMEKRVMFYVLRN